MRNQAGFTIVELVVVIIILGILAATALPRFLDISDDAHASAVSAVVGGLRASQGMMHAEWLAEGKPSGVSLGSSTVTMNSSGYAQNNLGCATLFASMLENGPSVVSSASAIYTDDIDWNATVANTDYCAFRYDAAGSSGTDSVVTMASDGSISCDFGGATCAGTQSGT